MTIRLLDWPLHEFLPALEETTDERLRERIRSLQEANPMLGWRACRLGLSFPEIYEMQVRAIVRAAIAVRERTGAAPLVEIMHPLVGFGEELRRLRELTVRVAAEEGELEYLVGTMIELPRACIRADEIAEHADFFSFGTNDLTQTALGISRDDGGRFLSQYLESGVLERDPFETIDQAGVGDLMRIAVERGRGERDDLKLGICGEHGGEPKSVAFCHELGLDYVSSCSPYRVPLARLAAAQAALSEQGVERRRDRRLTLPATRSRARSSRPRARSRPRPRRTRGRRRGRRGRRPRGPCRNGRARARRGLRRRSRRHGRRSRCSGR